jgi:hypothetical protein
MPRPPVTGALSTRDDHTDVSCYDCGNNDFHIAFFHCVPCVCVRSPLTHLTTYYRAYTHVPSRSWRAVGVCTQSNMSMSPRELTIDLSDKDAWDDTALIRAYDRAIRTYDSAHTAGGSGHSKHSSRTHAVNGTDGSVNFEEWDEEGEEGEDEEEEESADDDEAANNTRARREIAAAEAEAAERAEAEAAASEEVEASEEARREAWARYYAAQAQTAQSQQFPMPASMQTSTNGSWAGMATPAQAPPGGGAYSAQLPTMGSSQYQQWQHAAPPAPHTSSSSHPTSSDYEVDLSNLIMAWYHCGFLTARFQERHAKRHGAPP